MSVIRRLYNRESYPMPEAPSEKERERNRELEGRREALYELLDDGMKPRFEELMDAESDSADAYAETAFRKGLVLGVRMMLEVLWEPSA